MELLDGVPPFLIIVGFIVIILFVLLAFKISNKIFNWLI